MLVTRPVAGPDDERRAELEHTFPGHMDLVPGAPRPDRRAVRLRAEHVPGASTLHARQARGGGVVVDQDGEGDALVFDEAARVPGVTGSDRDHFGARCLDLVVSVAQLRGVLAAVQSPEVSKEDQDDGTVAPVVAEPVVFVVGAAQDDP